MPAGRGAEADSRRRVAVLVFVLVLGAGLPSWADGNVHLIFGARCDSNLGDFPLGLDCLTGDAEVGERTELLGGMIQTGGKDWPVRLEFGFLYSRGADDVQYPGWMHSFRYESQTAEIGIGFVKTWFPSRRWRLYAGGGGSGLYVSRGKAGNSYTDYRAYGMGLYAHGGGYMVLGGSFHVGIDFRTLLMNVMHYYHPPDRYGLSDDTFHLDGAQIGLIVGFGWPAER